MRKEEETRALALQAPSPGVERSGYERERENRLLKRKKRSEIVLRLSSCILCAVGFAFLITDKQVKHIPFLPGIFITKEAKYTDSTPLLVSIAVLGFASVYSLLQSFRCMLSNPNIGSTHARLWFLFIADQLSTYLLLASSSATTEMSYVAETGLSSFGWNKVCVIYTRFCTQVGVAIMCSLLSVLLMAATSILSAYHLFSST